MQVLIKRSKGDQMDKGACMSDQAVSKQNHKKKTAGLTQEERRRLEENMDRNDELMKLLAKM